MRGPRIAASAWAALLLDGDPQPAELCAEVHSGDPLAWPGYVAQRDAAAGEEAVRVFAGRVQASPCMLIAFEFGHLGGSVGAGAGGRIAGAFALAAKQGVPVVSVVATGGSRMQEGVVSLAQIPRTVVAARAHAAAGLLHVAVASDPTTGGVYAAFVSQADLLVAEPGAYVAFAGPRVVTALGGPALPADANRAETALANGLVDAVVARTDLRDWIGRALRSVQPTPGCVASTPDSGAVATHPGLGGSAWTNVQAARAADRPRATDLVALLDDATRLSGDRCGGVDGGVVAALGRLRGRPVAVLGQDRTATTPAGYRTAWRLFDLAGRLDLPIITLVDTPGADPTPGAEAAGLVHALSQTLARLLEMPAPTVAVVIGEGGSGGSMVLCGADRLLVQRTAVASVIAPEGAAAILHRDRGLAPEVAEQLGLRAEDLVRLGVADAVVADEPLALLDEVAAHLAELSALPAATRLDRRLARWADAGSAHQAGGHR